MPRSGEAAPVAQPGLQFVTLLPQPPDQLGLWLCFGCNLQPFSSIQEVLSSPWCEADFENVLATGCCVTVTWVSLTASSHLRQMRARTTGNAEHRKSADLDSDIGSDPGKMHDLG